MTHLSLRERETIEAGLRAGRSFKAIAREIGKSPATVMREVRKRAQASDKGAKGRVTNRCVKRSACTRQFVCERCERPQTGRHCASCARCNSACPEFVEMSCPRLDRPPYVCNGCSREGICVLRKRFYVARQAEDEYRSVLVASRSGFASTQRELDGLAATLRLRLRECRPTCPSWPA